MLRCLPILLFISSYNVGICQQTPDLLLMNIQNLKQKKQQIVAGDASLLPAYQKLIAQAHLHF